MSEKQTVVIKLEVSEEKAEDILFMLEPELTEMDRDRLLSEFALLGFEHFYEWMSGQKRFRTLTEQYISWLEDVYTRLLPEDEIPSYARLYNRFNIPYGQAGYIIRVLNEKELPHLRLRAREELKAELEKCEKQATDLCARGDLDRAIPVRMTALASRELRNLTGKLYRKSARENRSTLLPERETGYGDFKTVAVPAMTIGELLEELGD